MIGEISGAAKIYLVAGRTDMRKSIDGLSGIISRTYGLDPFSNAIFLFCGKRSDRIKILYYEKTGFVLYYKVLDSGRFQWPRDKNEARMITRQQFRWLMDGISIDQPKAIQQVPRDARRDL